MSHLLRKPWHIGLFHDVLWCDTRGDGIVIERNLQEQTSPTPEGMLAELQLLLADIDKKKLKPRKVDVLVSDQLAAFLTLAWQDALQNQNEIDGYAQIKFEKMGIVINDEWVMHTEFRDFRAMGIAYAFPRQWLQALCSILAQYQLIPRRIMPISSAVVARQPKLKRGKTSLVFLSERDRICAMVHDHSGLLAYEVEPVVGDPVQSRTRLLRRVHARFNVLLKIMSWQSMMTSTSGQLEDAELQLFWMSNEPVKETSNDKRIQSELPKKMDDKLVQSTRTKWAFSKWTKPSASSQQHQHLTRGHWFPL